ncbi:ABC transporter permease [Methylotenera sp.]|uniref:ABC transporter permease n=1 Tax=Methylotenera sp. TaxID=2051956 RepID=UPI002487BC2E|nr:ABC transporter permease [Methylotenera sp.]MDI1299689.1 ABC transporter permease [Methylotenera sp.]
MSSSSQHIVVIEAGRIESAYWKDLWRYRELFFFLAWRDVLVRYKQTFIGVLWSVIKPLLTMMVFVFVFGKLAKLPSDGVPYPVLVLSGMLPWLFFASAFSEAGNSLVGNANIISKVYFPRLIVPLSSVIVSLVDFLISGVLLVILMIWFNVLPDSRVLFLPFFIVLLILAAVGAGLWVAALNVKYRDFAYVVPFVIQFGLYVSPVAFNSNIVPEKWRLLYALNPMVGIIDGFRWSITGTNTPLYWQGVVVSVVVVILLIFSGVQYFRATERSFADVI